jgi:hypothetical protein
MDVNLFGRTWLVNLSFESLRLRLAHWLCVRAASRAILKMMRMWRREITAVTVLSTPVMIL